MNIPRLPFEQVGDKIVLTGPVFLSCGCGNVIARWASVKQNLATRIPEGKPKSSRIIYKWIDQEGLKEKYPVLKQHTYGVVVAHTDRGIEGINIMAGATMKVAEEIAQLIKRNKEYEQQHNN